ncbi:hypothetical protein [Leptospira bandrabouensis]|uniref:Restriction endonuclease type IV Mrr domain-containing protein n=1 Tax=Leptospira bandrabouensis TaxID=2484903 RepID=A0A6H3NNM0_9LEPT|nr:hypothetical protein [Leptospira bandrabouensis]MCG6154107.1 hypothetical protein [Leptospira bandrabouensis]TGN10318.1 hypothetical protein EHR08_19610 [Leptospira bandrabouensis]
MITNFKKLQDLYTKEGARYAFELLVKDLLNSENGPIRSVALNQGDNGIECYLGSLDDKSIIFQCKYFPEQINKSQQNQIRESFNRIKNNKDLKCEKWILCIPKDLNFDENAWFDTWKSKQTIPIELYDESFLRHLLNKHHSIRDHYFQNSNIDLLKSIIQELYRVNISLENLIAKRRTPDLKLGIITNGDEFSTDKINILPFSDYKLLIEENISKPELLTIDDAIKYIQTKNNQQIKTDEISQIADRLFTSYTKHYTTYQNSIQKHYQLVAEQLNKSFFVFFVENNGTVPASNISVKIKFPQNLFVTEMEYSKNFEKKDYYLINPPNVETILNDILEDDEETIPLLYPFYDINKFNQIKPLPLPSLFSKNAVRDKIKYNEKTHIAHFWLNRVSHAGRYDFHIDALSVRLKNSDNISLKYTIICDEYENFVEGELKFEFTKETTQKLPFDQFK